MGEKKKSSIKVKQESYPTTGSSRFFLFLSPDTDTCVQVGDRL